MKHMPPSYLKYKNKKKLCLICEGYEEHAYLSKLISLKIWNPIYDIKLINAKSNGNIFSHFQNAFQSGHYEHIFILCDTDKKPYTDFLEINKKVNAFLGKKDISSNNIIDDIIIYSNPCIAQILIFHWCDEILTSHKKYKIAPTIENYTGVKDYNAHELQLNEIMKKIDKNNYSDMKQRLQKNFSNYKTNGSSNFITLLKYLESNDFSWIKKLSKKIF